MDSSTKPSFLLSITLFAFLCFKPTLAVAAANSTLNYTNLIYNHCPNQTPTIPTSILSSLFQQLIAQSSQLKFFETIVHHENTAISGLFQCRGDLNFQDCNNCVNRVGKLSNSLCGNTVPARIQLSGCYIRYEANSGAVKSRFELLHKNCGESEEYGGFTEKRDVGFEEVIGCVGSNSDGFCEKKVEGMKVMAQCEEKMRGCECGECVSNAVEVAKEECRDSVSAQIYVEGCFLSYSYDYYSHGEHQKEHPEKGTGGGGGGSVKLVAIVVGGIAALSLGVVLWYAIKNCGKKTDALDVIGEKLHVCWIKAFLLLYGLVGRKK
ncbi:hypothetical protein LguiA_016584 [Lonicera macranthoides]